MTHDIAYYSDNHMKIAFCLVCGAEGYALNFECSDYSLNFKCSDKFDDKKVDKDTEPK